MRHHPLKHFKVTYGRTQAVELSGLSKQEWKLVDLGRDMPSFIRHKMGRLESVVKLKKLSHCQSNTRDIIINNNNNNNNNNNGRNGSF